MSGRPKRKKISGSNSSGGIIDVDAVDIGGDNNTQNKKRPRQQSSQSQPQQLVNTRPHSRLPSYLSEAFSELYSQDGLVVMGKGLGWLGLLCSFVRFYGDVENGYVASLDDGNDVAKMADTSAAESEGGQSRKKPPLIFVLNLKENERQVLISTLSSWGTPTDELPRIITNEAGQASERAALYARGGVFVITSRILIVDLLQGTAKSKDIEGMLVAHADKVVGEKSTEAFILRIFRSQRYFMDNSLSGMNSSSRRNSGFIKAFTDDASSVVSGFAKVDKVLKSLQVQRLYLYPRFHESVASELERQPPTVIELHQPLSDSMKRIQDALAQSMRACLRDLKQKSSLIDFSFLLDANGSGGEKKKRKRDATGDDYLHNYARKKSKRGESTKYWKVGIQQCIATNIAYIIDQQLEGDRHRLGRDAKQLIHDLRTLRQLFHYLIEYDCVQFLTLLQGVKNMSASSNSSSAWMLQDSGENLFRLAKERVYRLVETKVGGGQKSKSLERVLEHKPKEALLRQVLTEVQNRWRHAKLQTDGDGRHSANVLLMVKDERALSSVRTFLSYAGEENRGAMITFKNYLDQNVERVKQVCRKGGLTVSTLPMEQRLLYEEHGPVVKFLYGAERMDEYDQVKAIDRKNTSNQWKKKHRRIMEEKARGAPEADTIRQRAYLEEAIEESKGAVDTSTVDMFQKIDAGKEEDNQSAGSSSSEDEDELAYKVEPVEGLSLFIRPFSKVAEGEASILLNEINPHFVVMYDSDPGFIRALEIYSNSMKPVSTSAHLSSTAPLAEKDRLQVFFLLYEASAEDIHFTRTLEREKEAFEKLIDHKQRMPTSLPAFNNFSTQEMQQACGGVGGSYAGGTLPLSMDSRTGGGKQRASKERRDIAVDIREFRAALPSVLHQGGMRLAPATLTVGDFVLSNVHCVERKSLSDLYGSFNNGRLRDQVIAMSKHYKCPCLLIEFDSDKNFSLQNPNDIGGDIRNDSITTKLCALAMEFPRLRILWSRNPHETLKIFKKLKRNHAEVDVEKAIEVGSNESLDELLTLGKEGGHYEDDDYDDANEDAIKMLMRLPGVNANNAPKIMSECDTIAELAKKSREELRRIAGPTAGQKLFTFFGQ